MKTFARTLAALLAASAGCNDVRAAADTQLQRLALCQDRWTDLKDDAVRMSWFGNYIETRFNRGASDDVFSPKSPTRVLGWSVTHIYPQSVGMGVGFSLTVKVDHARARAAIANQVGQPMNCTASEGVRSCAVEPGCKRTAVLMAGQNGRALSSLMGCYHFYRQ